MAAPNFFVVGTPKAGTTALYYYLDQHPSIYMSPIKEPAFFAADLFELKRQLGITKGDPRQLQAYLNGPMTDRRSGVISDWDDYLKLFKNVQQETAVGEVSANYLGSSIAPRAIRERLPHARIVMMLRDPVDRLYSQYSEALAEGEAQPDFLSWVNQQRKAEEKRDPRLGAVWNGFYARHVARYREHFPAEQIRIYFYQDYRKAPGGILKDIFMFLNVDAHFEPDTSRRHNITFQPRSRGVQNATAPLRSLLRNLLPTEVRERLRSKIHRRPRQLTAAERSAVLRIYEQDIRELQDLLKRDLSEWIH
jgi:hypothetical protein